MQYDASDDVTMSRSAAVISTETAPRWQVMGNKVEYTYHEVPVLCDTSIVPFSLLHIEVSPLHHEIF